jgi:hypothetical protein
MRSGAAVMTSIRLAPTVFAVLALAACGSSGKPPASAGSAAYVSFLHFSECMRLHGVPNFPDPSPGGGIHITAGTGLNPGSPSFQAAQKSCRHLLPGGGPPHHVPESVKLSMLKHAECMREHGVPTYPDPIFPSGGGIGIRIPSGVNPSSPAFQSAAKACGGP